MNACEQIIENEGRSLYLIADLLADNKKDKREIIEQIVDKALKHLYAHGE